jgi:hypothetical protein
MPDLSAEWLDLVQWPAMVVSIVAAWLVASQNETRREIGFWVFLASNVLWVAWGLYDDAWALIGLNLFLGGMNVRGIVKNDRARRQNG